MDFEQTLHFYEIVFHMPRPISTLTFEEFWKTTDTIPYPALSKFTSVTKTMSSSCDYKARTAAAVKTQNLALGSQINEDVGI